METDYHKDSKRLKEYQKEYYHKNREIMKEHSRKYYKELVKEHPEKIKMYRENSKENQREYYRNWYKENGRSRADNYVECALEYKQKYPERTKIGRQLTAAVRAGKIKRPDVCPKCGRRTRVHAHHYNYDHFMNFVWLCASCHRLEHTKNTV